MTRCWSGVVSMMTAITAGISSCRVIRIIWMQGQRGLDGHRHYVGIKRVRGRANDSDAGRAGE